MRCGLLGQKLGHSYSPQIHSHLGQYSYELFEKEPEDLEAFLRSDSFDGLNVTIPYKKSVIPYCDALSDRAKKLGAVNTIVRTQDGHLTGHNTDYFGFNSMVAQTGLSLQGKKVLVLGSGGASATAVSVLKELGSNVVVISRTGKNNYSNLDQHWDASLIVNTTPVGMYPNVGISPVDLEPFYKLEGVLDVIYNPARTQLLLDAEKRGLITANGLWMLVAQAKESAEWFQNIKIPDCTIANIHRVLRRQMENIILIGMPGCGKSTIGRLVAAKTGKEFVDADTMIEQDVGCTIPQIFEHVGESGFRDIETRVLSKIGKKSGLVIATGGGCVTQPRNYSLLHQNATIYWIQRDPELLPTEGRPLSEKGKLHQMYLRRSPMYRAFADKTVINDTTAEETAAMILSMEGYT